MQVGRWPNPGGPLRYLPDLRHTSVLRLVRPEGGRVRRPPRRRRAEGDPRKGPQSQHSLLQQGPVSCRAPAQIR